MPCHFCFTKDIFGSANIPIDGVRLEVLEPKRQPEALQLLCQVKTLDIARLFCLASPLPPKRAGIWRQARRQRALSRSASWNTRFQLRPGKLTLPWRYMEMMRTATRRPLRSSMTVWVSWPSLSSKPSA